MQAARPALPGQGAAGRAPPAHARPAAAAGLRPRSAARARGAARRARAWKRFLATSSGCVPSLASMPAARPHRKRSRRSWPRPRAAPRPPCRPRRRRFSRARGHLVGLSRCANMQPWMPCCLCRSARGAMRAAPGARRPPRWGALPADAHVRGKVASSRRVTGLACKWGSADESNGPRAPALAVEQEAGVELAADGSGQAQQSITPPGVHARQQPLAFGQACAPLRQPRGAARR